MIFLLTDSNVGKHIDVLSLGESSEHFLGSIFLQEVLATFFCRTHGFANSGHKLGSLIVGSHEYSIEREDGD